MNSDQYEPLAKATLVVAKVLSAVVVLTQLYDLPKASLLGVLVGATMGHCKEPIQMKADLPRHSLATASTVSVSPSVN
ncbi:hypothetical protein [Haloarcula argentinensis]|uniref:hypothetical protein n=1 Tax=Haloarcula argentinensis TaxID=43776 RepID=UPI00166A8117|nr:hypothetical protein [Haloarcula argentinensis]